MKPAVTLHLVLELCQRRYKSQAFVEMSACVPCGSPKYLMHSLIYSRSQEETDCPSTIARECQTTPPVLLKALLEVSVPFVGQFQTRCSAPHESMYRRK